MRFLPQDGRFLERSLALAEDAAAFASPNPTVGCVLVRGGTMPEVLGEGAHRYDGRDHAEIVALKAAALAGSQAHGATAYVTLEPCSHQGRTGPCADALVAAGIARCVVATVDPNPLVSGQGIAKLRAAGIEVDLLDPSSTQAQRARRLNDAFAFSIQHGRPFVTLKAAVSRDGKLAPDPAKRLNREPFWLTGPAAREDVQHLRHRTDAILTGIGTVLADDPSLTDRTGLPRRRPLLRVVLDSELRTPLGSALFASAQGNVLLLTSFQAPADREQALRSAGAEIIRISSNNGSLDLNVVQATLAAIAVRSVLVEAGSTLNGALLRDGMADKVILYQAPVELGVGALPFAQGGPSPAELLNRLQSSAQTLFPNGEAEDQRTAGYLRDPWSGI